MTSPGSHAGKMFEMATDGCFKVRICVEITSRTNESVYLCSTIQPFSNFMH